MKLITLMEKKKVQKLFGTSLAENIFKQAKNDKEDGIWNQWFENGQLKLEAHYKNGKEDGLFTLFYDSGTKRSESNFVNGEKVGYETYWERNGDVKSKTLYKSKSSDKDYKPVN